MKLWKIRANIHCAALNFMDSIRFSKIEKEVYREHKKEKQIEDLAQKILQEEDDEEIEE